MKDVARAFRQEQRMRQRFRDRYPDIEDDVSITSLTGLRLGRGVQLRKDAEIFLLPPGEGGAEQSTITLGNRVRVGRRVQLGSFPNTTMIVGDDTSFQAGCVIIGDVAIGSNCLFSLHVFISSGNHFSELRPDWLIRDQDRLALENPDVAADRSAPVTIEDDCWLGWGTIVKRGVYVGKGAVIGSYSIVTKDVPPYSVQAGGPSRELRKRLEFKPPSTVCASNEHDHPYFYSGFLLRKSDLVRAPEKAAVRLQGSRGRIVLAGGSCTQISIVGSLEGSVRAIRCALKWNRMEIHSAIISDRDFELKAEIPLGAQSESARKALPGPLREFNELTIEVDEVRHSPAIGAIDASASRPVGAIDSSSYIRIHRCSCLGND